MAVILISGCTQGIGKAIATQFAQQQWHIVGFARHISKDYIQELLDLGAQSVHIQPVDASEPQQIKNFVAQLPELYHNIDVLVNNVGIYTTGSLFTESDTQWVYQHKVNVDAAYYLSKAIFPKLIKGSYVFNIGSVAAQEIVPEAPTYSITKHAFYALHKAMKGELNPLGIKTSILLLGATYTHSWKDSGVNPNDLLPVSDVAMLIWQSYHLASQTQVDVLTLNPFTN